MLNLFCYLSCCIYNDGDESPWGRPGGQLGVPDSTRDIASAIIDANITTFITAVILFVMGSGPVRGFSITLGLGILTSVFTAIFVTRLLVVMWFERRRPRTLEV